jgi:hypothetical protein
MVDFDWNIKAVPTKINDDANTGPQVTARQIRPPPLASSDIAVIPFRESKTL